MSPRVRERLRQIAGLWLAWTVAGLFYITQDSVPRLYRGEYVPWKYVFVGWMTGMYICALRPAILWLGNWWPLERRVTYAGFHLSFSVVFSIVSTVIEVPLLMALGVFPAASPPPTGCRGRQGHAFVRPSGRRHPVLGSHRASAPRARRCGRAGGENAVRHGLGQSEDGVTIDVSATRRDGLLALVVSDDGPGLQPPRLEQPGIGLANTRSRLARPYADRAGLVAENTAPHGARVTITLPLRTPREESACG